MPCDCSHMEPNQHEREIIRVSKCYSTLAKRMGREVPSWIKDGANGEISFKAKEGYWAYGHPSRIHEATAMLCALCAEAPEGLIYDGRDAAMRKVADWWDDHQEADKVKARKAKEDAAREVLAASALSKLTADERAAVGL